MVESEHPTFTDIGAIASAALDFSDVSEMTAFMQRENAGLTIPFSEKELQVLIDAAAKDIRRRFSKFDAGECLSELQSIKPAEDQKDRFNQARECIDRLIAMDGRRADIQLFIETDVFDHFNIKTSDPYGKNLRRHLTESFTEKRKSQKTTVVADEEETFQFPEDIMDKPTGRSRVYHTLANGYIAKNILKCIHGKLRRYVDGVYPESDENVEFIKAELIISGDKHGVTLTDSDAKHVLKLIESKTLVRIEDCEPNKDNIVVVDNGILNLKTWELEPFSPDKVYFSKLPVPYLPDAPEPTLFKKFMDTAFRGNESQALLVQEMVGFILMKNYKYQSYFYLVGSGGEGKGTLLEIIRYLIGSDNVSAASLFQLSDHPQVDYHVAELAGKFANICGDAGCKQLENTETIKKLTSNTDPVQGRRVRERPFNFINYAKLIIAMNRLPKSNAFTIGDRRRLVVINFNNKIKLGTKEEIRGYGELVRNSGELPGVLIWAIEGLKRLEAQQGFSDSRTLSQKTIEYERKSRPVRYFVEECLEEAEGNLLPNTILYERFTRFCLQTKAPELSATEIKQEVILECLDVGWKNVYSKLYRVNKLPIETQSLLKSIGLDQQRIHCFYGVRLVDDTPTEQPTLGDFTLSGAKGFVKDVLAFKESHPVFKHFVTDDIEFAAEMKSSYPDYSVKEIREVVTALRKCNWQPTFA